MPKNSIFSSEEMKRYARHFVLPGFGVEAQQKLKMSKVLITGCGGLGCPLMLYLAAAGVGTLGIIDFDKVEESNLQRQVLYRAGDIGKFKTEAAKQHLQNLNPHINIIAYNIMLTSENVQDIMKDYDVVADGTDNFPTRYLVNDAAVLLSKPNVYGSVFRFEGQVSVFNYRNKHGDWGPNYRDIYPVPPSPGLVQGCAEGGVLGVLPGIIGSMQASEVIKIITGTGEPLSGKLWVFDALNFETRILNIKKNPDTKAIKKLTDNQQFCETKKMENMIKEISVEQFTEWMDNGEDIQIIDVREPEEYEQVNIGGLLIPLGTVTDNAAKIARDKKVVVHCKMGARSAKAIYELQQTHGFDNLYNLKGGIFAYLQAGYQDKYL